jgi:hypothetical protein
MPVIVRYPTLRPVWLGSGRRLCVGNAAAQQDGSHASRDHHQFLRHKAVLSVKVRLEFNSDGKFGLARLLDTNDRDISQSPPISAHLVPV